MTAEPLPEHRPRPLVLAADEPSETIPASYGLAIELYPPAPARCCCCRLVARRVTRRGVGLLCLPCAELEVWCAGDHTGDHPEHAAGVAS